MGVGGHRHTLVVAPQKREPLLTVQEAGWAPGLVWMGAEILAPTGIQTPHRPAHD